jgi:rhodanese-related sulfurtransferase
MPRSRSITRQFWPVVVLVAAIASVAAHTDITPEQAYEMIQNQEDLVVLDVREFLEFCGSMQHIENAANLAWNSGALESRFGELPPDVDIIVVCGSGGRSDLAANFLDGEGFTRVFDMLGGMRDWVWETEPCGAAPVLKMSKTVSGAELDWSPVTGSQDYDLLRGQVENLVDATTHIYLGTTECLADDSPFTYFTDAAWPLGTVYYLTRQMGAPSWGESSGGLGRTTGSVSCD